MTAIIPFESVLLHKLGHSVVALRYKIPVRHITLFIFGGIILSGSEPPGAIAEFWISIALKCRQGISGHGPNPESDAKQIPAMANIEPTHTDPGTVE